MARSTCDLIVETVGVDSTVSVVSGALITVAFRNTDGTAGSAATVYSVASGNTTLSQPITSDAQGRIPGWFDPGDYLLQVVTGNQTYTQAFTAPLSSAAADVSPTSFQTGTVTAAVGQQVRMDISSGNGIINLPTAPANGARVGHKIVRVNATPGTFTLTVNCGGADTFSTTGTSKVSKALGEGAILEYRSADTTWTAQATDSPFDNGLGAPRTGNDGTIGTTGGTALGTNSVTTASITANAVTSAKIASGAAATNVGTVGGVLSGTLPNPGMAASAAATNVGSLGGDASGTLPNPTVVKVNGTTVYNGSGSPAGVVAANRIGDLYVDTTNGRTYQASAADNAHWSRLSVLRFGAATTGVSGGYSADTYVAGSGITIPVAGGWQAGTIYRCTFDMTKTGAGTATPVAILRIGTAGTTSDAAICTFTFGAGTAAADTGVFEFNCEFRSVGSGTSAVVAGLSECRHQLASTGLTSTGTAGYQAVPVASSGFNSTTSTTIGVSFNGGASFSGTQVMCDAQLYNMNV